jgi:hypothetical protein
MDQSIPYFFSAPPKYLNKSIFPWESYPTNYRNYFDKAKLNGITYFTINRKFSEQDYTKKPLPQGRTKVLGIGDSFTEGQGVRFKDTYIKRLELIDPKLFGINVGRSDSSLKQVQWAFNKHASRVKPDFVFYGYCLNDMEINKKNTTITPLDFDHEHQYKGDIGLKWDFIMKRSTAIDRGRSSNIYNLIKWSPILSRLYEFYELNQISKNTIQHYKDIYSTNKNSEGINSTLKTIKTMQNESKKLKAKFVVIIFPLLYWPNGNYDILEAQNTFIQKLKEKNISFIDMTPVWMVHNDKKLWVHPFDQHPNDFAHGLVANEIKKFIDKNK